MLNIDLLLLELILRIEQRTSLAALICRRSMYRWTCQTDMCTGVPVTGTRVQSKEIKSHCWF